MRWDGWGDRVRGRGWVAALLPVPLLLLSAVLTLTEPGVTVAVAPTLGLAGAGLVLLVAMALPGWRGRPVLRGGYYLVLLAVFTALVVCSPWFMFVSWVTYTSAFRLFETRWAFFGAAASGVLLTAAQTDPPGLGAPRSMPLFAVGLLAPLLAAGWHLGRESETRRRLIARLADANRELEAALAANAELHEQVLAQAHAAGVHAERERLAREIHDTLAQGLSAMVTQLEVVLTSEHGLHDRWRGRVARARDLAREGMAEARRSVRALAPQELDGARLPAALDRLVRSWRERTGIDASLEADAADPDVRELPVAVEAALLRVGQEALTNVAKHAAATRVRVTLSYLDDLVLLDVRDDGAGFDECRPPAGTGDRGFGLTSMRRRLGELGGRLEIETGPGAGTAVCASVPIGAVAR